MIVLILNKEEEELNHSMRRKRVHEAWKKIGSEGNFVIMYKELIVDGAKLFRIFENV